MAGKFTFNNTFKEELVKNEIEVVQIKEKSFFNFFWLCSTHGLKKPYYKTFVLKFAFVF